MDGHTMGDGRRAMREALRALRPDAPEEQIEATLDEMFLRLGGLFKQHAGAVESDAFERAACVAEGHNAATAVLAPIFRRMAAEARG